MNVRSLYIIVALVACTPIGAPGRHRLDAGSTDELANDANRTETGRGGADAGRDAKGTSEAGTMTDRDAMPDPDAPCTAGMLRCAEGGGSERQLCDNAAWVSAAPCPNDQRCDTASSDGSCLVVTACSGKPDETVCEGAELSVCGADGVPGHHETCTTPRHCQAGLPDKRCAICLPGEHRCSGAKLERCSDDASSFELVETCDTAALCNETAKACTDSVCLQDTRKCDGDKLLGCKADLSGFEPLKTCMPGMCDMAGGECDTCAPNTRACASATALAVCDAAGQQAMMQACPVDQPVCTGEGACVQCAEDSDCAGAKECEVGRCNKTTGKCVSQPKPSGSCAGGVCDGTGYCVPCLNDSHCTGTTGQCVNRTCKACDPANGSSDCRQPAELCQESVCQNDGTCSAPRAKANATCDGVCSSGICVACVTGRDCASGHCTNNQCTQCDQTGGCESRMCQLATCSSHGTCSWTANPGASCGSNGMVCNSNGGCTSPNYDRCTASGQIDDPSRRCSTRGIEGLCNDYGYCQPMCVPGAAPDCPQIGGGTVSCEYFCVIKCPCPAGMRCETSSNNCTW
jgi:hypothetical protein